MILFLTTFTPLVCKNYRESKIGVQLSRGDLTLPYSIHNLIPTTEGDGGHSLGFGGKNKNPASTCYTENSVFIVCISRSLSYVCAHMSARQLRCGCWDSTFWPDMPGSESSLKALLINSTAFHRMYLLCPDRRLCSKKENPNHKKIVHSQEIHNQIPNAPHLL